MQRKQRVGEKSLQADTSAPAKYQYTFIDYLMLVAAIFICLWAWIFVEPDTLQRSAAAQTVVKIVTSVVPWVAALERYGPQAHKLLLVHSVCYLVFLPLTIVFLKKTIKNRKTIDGDWYELSKGLLLSILIFGISLAPYYKLSKTFAGTAGRTGYGLLIHSWSMPFMACLMTWFTLVVAIAFLVFLFDCLRNIRGMYA